MTEKESRVLARSELVSRLVIELGVGLRGDSSEIDWENVFTESVEILLNAIAQVAVHHSHPHLLIERVIMALEERGAAVALQKQFDASVLHRREKR